MNIVKLYQSGLSTQQVGEKIGRSESSVRRFLAKEGVPRRSYVLAGHLRHQFRRIQLTDIQKQLVFGSLLGDACLSHSSWLSKKSGNKLERWSLRFAHAAKQLSYLRLKWLIMDRCGKIGTRKSGHGSTIHHFAFCNTPTLSEIAAVCVRDGRKQVTPAWLSNIDERGVAFWFQDDGSCIIRKPWNHPTIWFMTHSFDQDELRHIISFMSSRFGVELRQTKYRKPGQFLLATRHKEEALHLLTTIAPWSILTYKFKGLVDLELIGSSLLSTLGASVDSL